jgi:hypothetical protein
MVTLKIRVVRRPSDSRKQSTPDENKAPPIPAQLSGRLEALMREIRRGASFEALVAIAGRKTVVYVSRVQLAPPHKKLLSTYLKGNGHVKYLVGMCTFDSNLFAFSLAPDFPGISKRIKSALFEQTGRHYAVKANQDNINVL